MSVTTMERPIELSGPERRRARTYGFVFLGMALLIVGIGLIVLPAWRRRRAFARERAIARRKGVADGS